MLFLLKHGVPFVTLYFILNVGRSYGYMALLWILPLTQYTLFKCVYLYLCILIKLLMQANVYTSFHSGAQCLKRAVVVLYIISDLETFYKLRASQSKHVKGEINKIYNGDILLQLPD